MLIGFAVQGWLRSAVRQQLKVAGSTGLTGAEIARAILDRNGLHAVPVEPAGGGALSDHYDPRSRSIHLSADVFAGRSVASGAIAAHEVGHAIQHATAYSAFRARSAMFPVVNIASQAWLLLLLVGAFMQIAGAVELALLLFGIVVLFQLVTLPVEFDASKRALAQLRGVGLVSVAETGGARKVLTAAALTYVAAALAAVAQLAYFAMMFLGRRD
ncbi:MAG: zinc metallopeptidase [Thermoleophilia bacterium]|nr:zinc metallopeptidase [Thermoleophilia bacterium]